jgi:transcriptional regulator with GAF, ATPase, and Fis domain
MAPSEIPNPGGAVDVAFVRDSGTARRVRRMLDDTRKLLGCDEAALWVFGDDGQSLTAALNAGKRAHSIEGVAVAIRGSLIGLVAMTGEGICVGPDAQYNQDVARALEVKTYAMVAAPVIAGDEICGVVSAVNLCGVTEITFSQEHLRTAQWMAYLMGLVLADCLKRD